MPPQAGGDARRIVAANVRRCLGMDAQCVHALSAFSSDGGRAGGIQRKVYVGSVRVARRFLCYSGGSRAGDLSKLLCTAHPMAILRIAIGGGRVMLATADYRLSQPELFRQDVLAGLAKHRKSLPCRWLYDARGSG